MRRALQNRFAISNRSNKHARQINRCCAPGVDFVRLWGCGKRRLVKRLSCIRLAARMPANKYTASSATFDWLQQIHGELSQEDYIIAGDNRNETEAVDKFASSLLICCYRCLLKLWEQPATNQVMQECVFSHFCRRLPCILKLHHDRTLFYY